jgi:phosphocarrier protein HPr
LKQFTYTIQDELGVHARPAGLLVKEAKQYDSSVTAVLGPKTADLKKLFALMGMGIHCGDHISIIIEGSDEDVASTNLKKFFTENNV